MRRRVSGAIAVTLFAGMLGVIAFQIYRSEWVQAYRARCALDQTRKRWDDARTQKRDRFSTYAAIAGDSRAAAWVELLAAAGVPAPALLSETTPASCAGYRLLVVYDRSTEEVERLANAGRAVIAVEQSGSRSNVDAVFWRQRRIPLAGQPAWTIDLKPGETAWISSTNGKPLAARRAVGSGVVIRLGLDIAEWLYRLRQGDRTRADRDADGNATIQPADLLPSLPTELADQPFADELIDDLLHTLDQGLSCPLPRTGGLPEGRPVVVLTSDQDYVDDDALQRVANMLEAMGVITTFLLTHPDLGQAPDMNLDRGRPRLVDSDCADRLLAKGFGLGVHPFIRSARDIPRIISSLAQRTGTRPLVARNHWLRWFGYLDIPATEAAAGIAVDLNYMTICADHSPCASFLGGSTRPVRFVSPKGEAMPILQQPTAIDDYSLRTPTLEQVGPAADVLGRRALALLKQARAVEGPLVINAHVAFLYLAPNLLKPLIDANARFMTVEQWLDFVARRRQSRIASPNCSTPPDVTLQSGVSLRNI
jgi:hypothetical protein